jgi:putative addiction module component (TIGR02574 family)
MVVIDEILQLPKEEPLAIMDAIQDSLDDFGDEDKTLSDEHIAFMKERIRHIEETNQPAYTWEQVEESLKNRRN